MGSKKNADVSALYHQSLREACRARALRGGEHRRLLPSDRIQMNKLQIQLKKKEAERKKASGQKSAASVGRCKLTSA